MTISNNSETTTSTTKSNTNESTVTVEYNKLTLTVSHNNTKTKSNKCTVSHQCDKTSTTPKSKNNIESPKDEAYEHMKSNLFTLLREEIQFGRYALDKIQYYPFLQHHKLQFIRKYCSGFKILNKKS